MNILLMLCLFSIFDVTKSISYKCNRRATCGCSKQSTVVLTKIVGGEPANTSESWGWVASLRKNDIHICGASVISPWFVITAAHCLNDIGSLSTISLNFDVLNISTIGQLRNVTKIFIHPLYDKIESKNDLAILRLNKSIDFKNSNISAICLPKASEFNLRSTEYPPVGAKLVAIGWGVTNFFMQLPSPILRQVTLRSMDSTEPSCTDRIYDDVVQFCAGYPKGGRDTCRGDSGGPLMLFKNGRWQLAGITSFGGICGAPGIVGVYTRVAYYDSFIKNIINSDDTFKSVLKPNDVEDIHLSSNARTFYQKSPIELIVILLCIVYKKMFFQN